MLCEIICDYFKQPRIQFYPGLNTVLGDGSGSNSIGKSTFLMIIDFVFGGNDYVNKSTDVQRNIGKHTNKIHIKVSSSLYESRCNLKRSIKYVRLFKR